MLKSTESSLTCPVIVVGIEKLKTSMEMNSVGSRAKEHLLVTASSDKKGEYFVIDGSHRFQAMLRLGRYSSCFCMTYNVEVSGQVTFVFVKDVSAQVTLCSCV